MSVHAAVTALPNLDTYTLRADGVMENGTGVVEIKVIQNKTDDSVPTNYPFFFQCMHDENILYFLERRGHAARQVRKKPEQAIKLAAAKYGDRKTGITYVVGPCNNVPNRSIHGVPPIFNHLHVLQHLYSKD